MLESEVVYFCVGVVVKLLIVSNSSAVLRQISKLIPEPSIFFISQASRIVHFLHRIF